MKQLLPAIALSVVLILGVFVLLEWTRQRPSQIILPAGENYFGPSR